METKNGYVSINTENIFPIIKKWLYSEKDIFLREIVSNGCDAINKLKKLISIGEADLGGEETEWRIEVSLDKEAGTITVFDNGIGMTEEEVIKYINQIAFSGVKDFVEKYEGKTDDTQIIVTSDLASTRHSWYLLKLKSILNHGKKEVLQFIGKVIPAWTIQFHLLI